MSKDKELGPSNLAFLPFFFLSPALPVPKAMLPHLPGRVPRVSGGDAAATVSKWMSLCPIPNLDLTGGLDWGADFDHCKARAWGKIDRDKAFLESPPSEGKIPFSKAEPGRGVEGLPPWVDSFSLQLHSQTPVYNLWLVNMSTSAMEEEKEAAWVETEVFLGYLPRNICTKW